MRINFMSINLKLFCKNSFSCEHQFNTVLILFWGKFIPLKDTRINKKWRYPQTYANIVGFLVEIGISEFIELKSAP